MESALLHSYLDRLCDCEIPIYLCMLIKELFLYLSMHFYQWSFIICDILAKFGYAIQTAFHLSFNSAYSCDIIRRLPLQSATQINAHIARINDFDRKKLPVNNVFPTIIENDHETLFQFLLHVQGSFVSEFNPFFKCHVKNQFLKTSYLQEYGTVTPTLFGKLLYLYNGISQEWTMLSQKVIQWFCLPAWEEETAAQILLFLFRLGAKLIVLNVYCVATSEWTKMGVISFSPVG